MKKENDVTTIRIPKANGHRFRRISSLFTTGVFQRFFVRRDAKDRLFRFVFKRDKQALLEIYNALNETNYTDTTNLEIITLEGVLYMSMKNDLAYLLVHTMNLYEQQSSYSPNWPLRMLIYTSQEYQKIALKNKEDLYSYKQIQLPKPKCVIFYSGSKDLPDESYMQLSDSFAPSNVKSDLELTVRVININRGHNEEFIKKCKLLEDYSIFVGQVDERVERGMALKTAIRESIDFCIQNGVMDDILLEYKAEVLGMVLTEYDERKTMLMLQREARADGRAEERLTVMKELTINLRKIAMPVEQIAQVTGQKIDTIQNWLADGLQQESLHFRE